jgi:DNA-binding HxlR family transcriptional regulator
MNSLKQNTGIGNWQIDQANKAKWSILKALSDGQWHRNMELKEKTRLSSRTLAKRLNEMTELQIIEKQTDIESKKYPVPVLYKATPTILMYTTARIARDEIANRIEPALDQSKDPLAVLEAIHTSSKLYFLDLLTIIKENKKITDKQIHFYEECFLWTPYKQYTSRLIQASRKIIDDLNIEQSLINQAKRHMRVFEKATNYT